MKKHKPIKLLGKPIDLSAEHRSKLDKLEDRVAEIEGFLSFMGSPGWSVSKRLANLEHKADLQDRVCRSMLKIIALVLQQIAKLRRAADRAAWVKDANKRSLWCRWALPGSWLPDDESNVLLTVRRLDNSIAVRAGVYSDGVFHDNGCCTYRPGDKDLIAWAYLPQPYKGGRK